MCIRDSFNGVAPNCGTEPRCVFSICAESYGGATSTAVGCDPSFSMFKSYMGCGAVPVANYLVLKALSKGPTDSKGRSKRSVLKQKTKPKSKT